MNAGTLTVEMNCNLARLADEMRQAKDIVGNSMAKVESVVASASGALGALGIGLSGGMFLSFIKGGIDTEDSLHKLALQTGITVETLSALRPIALEAGTNLDTAAGMVNKLEKSMLTFAQSGTGKTADAFKQLGYSQDQVKVGLQNIDTFLPEFAERLLAAGVGGEQAGLAMQLMAKGGAAALSFLQQLVETGTLHAKVTTAQADAAHQFEVSLAKLKEGSALLSIAIANDLLPGLNRFTDAMVKARTEGGLLSAVWAGLRSAYGGSELDKVNKDFFDQTSKLMALEQQLGKADIGDPRNKALAEHIALLKDDLAGTRARWELLSHEQDLTDKAKVKAPNTPLVDLPGKVPGMSEHDLQVYANAVQAVKELDAAEKDREKNLADEDKLFVSAMKEFDTYIERQNEQLAQQAQNWKDLVEPMEPYRRQLAEINNLYELNKLTSAQWGASMDIVAKNMGDASKVSADKTVDVWKTAARDMQRGMSSLFFDVMTGNFKTLGQQFTNYIAKMIADAQAAKMSLALFGPNFSKTGDVGGLIGQGLSALGLGAPSNMAYGSTTFAEAAAAGVIPMASGGDYMVNKPTLFLAGEAGPERASFSGANNTGGGGNAPPPVIQFNISTIGPRDFAQWLAQPLSQRMIRGAVEQAYNANGTVSGMAAR